MLIVLTSLVYIFTTVGINAQSNYAIQANSIEYQPGLPPSTILDGKVTKLDELSPIIFLNRTKAYLNCGQGSMQVELKFDEPFYGVAYADFDRNSACMVQGRGLDHSNLELPLKGCGTRQDPQRVFTNNIVVRFHPGLEIDGDEVITIICRYPPPITPKPAIAEGVLPPITSGVAEPVKPFQILLTICALLFLSLLLLGLGCSYLCLKRRNVRVVHRHPFESAAGSEITKLSDSSIGNISMFEALKIPRAHALLHAAPSSSGSETNLVLDHSDTLPSDYPSESHSEIGLEASNAYVFQEIHSGRSTTSLTPGFSQIDDARSLPQSSAVSYDNKDMRVHGVQVRSSSSIYSETVTDVESSAISTAIASKTFIPRHLLAIGNEPKFDVQMRVKQAPLPPRSPLPSESDASIALEKNLTTILERKETTLSMESTPKMTNFSHISKKDESSGNTSSRQITPPVYSKILKKQTEQDNYKMVASLVSNNLPAYTYRRPETEAASAKFTENRTTTALSDSSHAKYRVANISAPTRISRLPTAITCTSIQNRESVHEQVEPLVEPIVSSRRPEITTHEVDDVFLRTITKKKTIEDVERHRRQVTEYHGNLQLDPKWDVTIRNYPTEGVPLSPPQWENFSDVSSASNLTMTNNIIKSTDDADSTIHPIYSRVEMPLRSPHGVDNDGFDDNWETLSRVLAPQYADELTEHEREKWREVISTHSTLRTLLTEATVKEDYELISKDARYHTLFPPMKWDVIIRILTPPPNSSMSGSSKSGQRYKRGKNSEWDNRSRRSSLPTLYEYDSDSGTSLRTHDILSLNSAYKKLDSARDDGDVNHRSMFETIRDFKVHRDNVSISSDECNAIVRSASQPAMVDGTTEFGNWRIAADEVVVWSPNTSKAVRANDEIIKNFDSGLKQTYDERTTHWYRKENTVGISEEPIPASLPASWFHDNSEPEMQI